MTKNTTKNTSVTQSLSLLSFISASGLSLSASAAIVNYTNQAEWEALNAGHTFIDFLGWDNGTPISDQYAGLGVTFVGGGEYAANNWFGFPIDGAGLLSFTTVPITAQFDVPRQAIGVNFKGSTQFTLFLGDIEVGKSQIFSIEFTGNFAGIVSSVPFDKVVIVHPGTGVSLIDNLFFGAAIPVPAPLALYALLGMSAGRRRRS